MIDKSILHIKKKKDFDDKNRAYFIGVISEWFIFQLFYG